MNLDSRPHALPIPARLRATVDLSTQDVVIAMVDSDFIAHPDLTQPINRIVRYVDAVHGSEHEQPPLHAHDRHWHGTMTACTAAGNGHLSQGLYTSLAPEARVVLIRTMHDDGRIPTSTITWALKWIARNAQRYGIRVVNISVYADELDQTRSHPVTAAVETLVANGIVVVAAAGNNPLAPIRPPAAAPSAITVGGLDDNNTTRLDDNAMYHSTFGITDLGVQKPDVIAPALWLAGPLMPGTRQQQQAEILFALDAVADADLQAHARSLAASAGFTGSGWNSDDATVLRCAINEAIVNGKLVAPFYKLVDGTSFASPIVASIVAQMIACRPNLQASVIKDVLMRTASPLPNIAPTRQGAGIVDPVAALTMIADHSETNQSG